MKTLYSSILIIFAILIVSLTSLSAQPVPVACFPFSGSSLDMSGNNHNGVVSGAVLTTDRFGTPSSAYEFDGVDDEIQITDLFGSFIPNNEFTIMFWASADMMGLNSPILLVPNDNADRLNISVHYDHNGANSIFWDYGSIFSAGRLSAIGLPFTNNWQHYAFVVSESKDSMYVYVDGGAWLEIKKAGTSSLINKNRNLNIGGGMSGITSLHFNGKIDEVQIFNLALTKSEIVDVFNNGYTCQNSVGLSEHSTNDYFTVYPNPANDELFIGLHENRNLITTMEIFDMLGKKVDLGFDEVQRMPSPNQPINISNLSAGVYEIKISTTQASFYKKFIKQ